MEDQQRTPVLPELLEQLIEKQYGSLKDSIIEGYSQIRPVTLRVNTLKAGLDEVCTALEEAGITYERVSWYDDALILPNIREAAVQALDIYAQGKIYLQSLSAMLPPLILQPKSGENILDMAAAPGGKTTQMAALSGGGAYITACEKNKLRAERLQYNLDMQGAKKVSVIVQDGRQLDDLFSFGRILLDAPCSGSGTVLLTPGEQQRRMTPDWLKKVCQTQTAMLTKALKLLKPGGDMIYSTCSILECENEGVLRRVLPQFKAELIPVEPSWNDALPCLPVTMPGTLCVMPTAMFEGFFIAHIKKLK